MMAKLLGMGGFLTVGSTPYPVTNWELDVENDAQDVTDTGSAGWKVVIAGVSNATVKATMFWDTAVNFSSIFAIGSTGTFVLTVGSFGQSFSVPALISSYSVKNDAKSPVEFELTGTGIGAITISG